ncbi:uncharacterized protein LOC135837536 [Planococcus citri]|uniref:uncharacterized protein LOC135837536 n=1 Tax=Planococcus citri TaxID=170843 RepID=UPI0031F8FEE1
MQPLFILLPLLASSTPVLSRRTCVCHKEESVYCKTIIDTEVQEFKPLIRYGNMFFDKTLLIREILQSPLKLIQINCPPKFGRSINLDMFKTFVSITVNSTTGEAIPREQTPNYLLFVRHRLTAEYDSDKLIKPLMIYKHSPELIIEHQGKYPVVYIDFGDINPNNDADMVDQFGIAISRTFNYHKYMLRVLKTYVEGTNETKEKKLKARSLFKEFRDIITEQVTDRSVIIKSMPLLLKLLYRHFQKKVYVLIDNFDEPLKKIIQTYMFPKADVKYLFKFYEKFMSFVHKGDKYIEKVILTGSMNISDILGPISDNLTIYNTLNSPWTDFYGVTEKDLEDIFKYNRVTGELSSKAMLWFGGYRYGAKYKQWIHNAGSVAQFLKRNETLPYFVNNTDTLFLESVLSVKPIRELMESFINGKKAIVPFNNLIFTKDDFVHLKNVVTDGPDFQTQNDTVSLVLSYFYINGFCDLKLLPNTTNYVEFKLNNKELQIGISRKLLSHYYIRFGLSHTLIDRVAGNLAMFCMTPEIEPSKRIFRVIQNTMNKLPQMPWMTPELMTTQNDDLVYATLNFISIKLRLIYKFDTEVTKEGRISYLLTWKKGFGGCVAMKYNTKNITELLHLSTLKRDRLTEIGVQKLYKFMAIDLSPNRTITITTECNT